jgi:hypothetical protein
LRGLETAFRESGTSPRRGVYGDRDRGRGWSRAAFIATVLVCLAFARVSRQSFSPRV